MTMAGEELGTVISDALVAEEPTSEETVEIEGLGECKVTKVHDDGDLTVLCGGKKFMVTPEGEVFGETEFKASVEEEHSDE